LRRTTPDTLLASENGRNGYGACRIFRLKKGDRTAVMVRLCHIVSGFMDLLPSAELANAKQRGP